MRGSLRVCAQAFSAVLDQVVSMRDRERARDGSVNILSCALCEHSLTTARDRFFHKGFSRTIAQLGQDSVYCEAKEASRLHPTRASSSLSKSPVRHWTAGSKKESVEDQIKKQDVEQIFLVGVRMSKDTERTKWHRES